MFWVASGRLGVGIWVVSGIYGVLYHCPGLCLFGLGVYHCPGLCLFGLGVYHCPGLCLFGMGVYHCPGLCLFGLGGISLSWVVSV